MNTSALPTQAADIIRKIAPNFTPKLSLVLGSGLGPLADSLDDPITISYDQLPGFPQLSVKGHNGQMTLGLLQGVPTVCLQGRAHTYETNSYQDVKTYVRTLKQLGCEIYLATNAAGSLRADVGPGSLVAVTDHINFQPNNPLVGPNDDEFGPRFPAMDAAYDPQLRQQLHHSAETIGIDLHDGVYISVLGPCYETTAEIRMYKMWGADVIGMSTVPEVIVAHHCGMRVAVISSVTNLATGLTDISHDHDAVIATAQKSAEHLTRLIQHFARQLNNG